MKILAFQCVVDLDKNEVIRIRAKGNSCSNLTPKDDIGLKNNHFWTTSIVLQLKMGYLSRCLLFYLAASVKINFNCMVIAIRFD